jgi:hypothetical protein
MTEFFLGVFTGYLLTWPALIIFVTLGIWAEYCDSGFSLFFLLLLGVCSYFFFGLSPEIVGIAAIAYFPIGLVWSFWRYRRYVSHKVTDFNAKHNSPSDRSYFLKSISPKEKLSSIVYWVLVWPFSMIENISRDLITFVEFAVKKVFDKVYTGIYESAIKDLKPSSDDS